MKTLNLILSIAVIVVCIWSSIFNYKNNKETKEYIFKKVKQHRKDVNYFIKETEHFVKEAKHFGAEVDTLVMEVEELKKIKTK